MSASSLSHLSQSAKWVVQKQHKSVTMSWEKCSHDGYDEMGPESDIYDLYIVETNGTKFIISRYHREHWYNGTPQPYELYDTYECQTQEELTKFKSEH